MRILASLVATFLIMAGSVSLAHSMIKAVNISSGDSLSESPSTFEITFSHKAALADIELETAAGETIETGYDAEDDMAETFVVDLPELENGEYLLTWKAIARDGHIMSDTIDFSVD